MSRGVVRANAGGCSNQQQQGGGAEIRQGVGVADAIEQACKEAGQQQRGQNAQAQTEHQWDHCSPQNHGQDIIGRSTECHTDPYLVCPESGCIRDDSIDSNRGQQHR